MGIATISPKQLCDQIQAGRDIELIDVRTPTEYREVHVACARNVPLDQLDKAELRGGGPGMAPVYVICRSGSRSQQGCERLVKAGLTNVISVEGGTVAWDQAGLPVVRGKKAISLERQVRIVAGAMVLAGALLSIVNPWWVVLSGFVGAGLIFAGITDTCGMGMILARMPWNQVRGSQGGSCCATSSTSTQSSTANAKTTCCQ